MSELIEVREIESIDVEIKEFEKVDIDLSGAILVGQVGEMEEVSVSPQTYEQVIEAGAGKTLKSVKVGAVTSDIDDDIKAENIRLGVSILGVEGNMAGDKPDQSKEVSPTENDISVKADTGYELAEVVVKAIPRDFVGSAVTRKAGQTYEVSEEDRVIPADMYLVGEQTIKGVVLDTKRATPSAVEQTITSDADGLREVVVEAIPNTYLDITLPENIYSGEVEVENGTD